MAETKLQKEVRRVSRAIFGNRHKLEVCAAIARGERFFYVQALSSDTGIPWPTISPVLKGMTDVLVRETPQVGSSRSAHYIERLDHPFWEVVSSFFEAIAAEVELQSPEGLPAGEDDEDGATA